MGLNKSMKSLLSMYAMMAALSTEDHFNRDNNKDKPIYKDETEEEKVKRLEQEQINLYKKQGLSKFVFENNSLWALNERSAIKKAKKKGWIS